VIFAHLIQTASSLPTDVSALQSSISALERDISALEREIKSLEISSVPWEYSVLLFTLLVFAGVVMELLVIRHDWRDEMEAWALAYFWAVRSPGKPSITKRRLEVTSVLLVGLGIAGELGIGIKITIINLDLRGKSAELRSKGDELRSKSDQLLALVTQKAGDAKTSAKNAHDEADEAKRKAGDVAKQADELNRNLLAAKTQLEAVDAKRAELERSLINMAVCNAPRVISNWFLGTSGVAINSPGMVPLLGGLSKSYVDSLRPMAGQVVFIEVVPDAEARRAALSIARTLDDAQWNVQRPLKLVDGLADGVSLQPSLPTLTALAKGEIPDMFPYRHASDVAEKLLDFLHSYNWQATKGWPRDAQGQPLHDEEVLPSGAIRIQVGLYPAVVYVNPPGQKELTSRMEELKEEDEKHHAEFKREIEKRLATQPPEVRQRFEQAEAERMQKGKNETSNSPCQVLNPLF
jgi:hypothetical protein